MDYFCDSMVIASPTS